EDAAALGPGVAVVPNGVDTRQFAATPLPDAHHLVFTGSLYCLPNIDGAQWFCREVLPRVRDAVTDVSVDIVGRDPTPEVRDLDRLPGVAVHADVPSVTPYLEQARVAVV